jgi:hypothetical protein
VRSLGPSRVDGGSSPHRRGGQIGALEPSLQGANGGQRLVGESAVQHHLDQSGSPGRMFPPQAHGGLHQGFGGLGCRRSTRVVRRVQGIRTTTTEAVEQIPDGARRQAKGLGDGGAILAVLVAPPDGLAQWHGDGARHRAFSKEDSR